MESLIAYSTDRRYALARGFDHHLQRVSLADISGFTPLTKPWCRRRSWRGAEELTPWLNRI
jgi:hypothetical protein